MEEALEKLRLGMYILIREATNAHNLAAVLPMLTPDNARRICFCTDDRHPGDLLDEGSVDHLVRTAIRAGVDVVTAIRMATLNTAEWFRLYDRGGIRPGHRADLIVFDDPQEFRRPAGDPLRPDRGRRWQAASRWTCPSAPAICAAR